MKFTSNNPSNWSSSPTGVIMKFTNITWQQHQCGLWRPMSIENLS